MRLQETRQSLDLPGFPVSREEAGNKYTNKYMVSAGGKCSGENMGVSAL